MQSYGKYNWRKNRLYLGKAFTGLSYVKFKIEDWVFYKIQFSEGDLSKDFYNLSRVKDNAVRYHQRSVENTLQDGPQLTA